MRLGKTVCLSGPMKSVRLNYSSDNPMVLCDCNWTEILRYLQATNITSQNLSAYDAVLTMTISSRSETVAVSI